MLPQTNARVLAVADGGASEDYDYTGGADVALWSGDVAGYVGEEKRLVVTNGKMDRVSVDYVIVDDIPVDVSAGRYVTFTDDEGTTQTRRVMIVAERPRIPGVLHTTKLYLESE